jgi:hypothetical protein
MNSPQRIMVTSMAGYAITAIGILGIGLLVVPAESRSTLFWPRMLWTEFLALLIWSSMTAFLRSAALGKEDKKRVVGVLHAAQMTLLIYAVLSFILMIAHSHMQETGLGNRTHLMAQMILGVAVGVLLVFLNITSTAAGHGLEKTFEYEMSPAELCVAIREREAHIRDFPKLPSSIQIEGALKTLREKIQYSIPTVGSTGTLPIYREFSTEVQATCDELALCDDTDSAECTALKKRIDALIRQAENVSAKTVKR